VDTLTHALSGALIARATARKDAPPRSIPRRVAAGFFACAAPDLDFIIGTIGPVEYLLTHRGVTHSLVLLPAWALLYSWILAKVLREPGGWRALYGVTALALFTHIVGDLITSFGTMIFAPFSDWRAAIGTTFIIDLWFSGIIVAGLAFSAFLYRTRVPAVAASVVLAGYVGFQYVQQQKALDFGAEYARSLGLQKTQTTVHPRPVSPFNWIARLDAAYMPLKHAIWVTRPRYGATDEALIREAWSSAPLAFFRWFADLPAFDGFSQGSTCVWFTDLRFLTPGRDTMPFRYRVCRERSGDAWRLVL
jgi:inner membrane protein